MCSLHHYVLRYKQLALKYHPDETRGCPDSAEIFKAVANAWALLDDKDQYLEWSLTDAGKLYVAWTRNKHGSEHIWVNTYEMSQREHIWDEWAHIAYVCALVHEHILVGRYVNEHKTYVNEHIRLTTQWALDLCDDNLQRSTNVSTLSTYEHINDLTGGGYVFLCRKKVRTLIFSHPGYFSDFFLYTPSASPTLSKLIF